MKAEKKLYWVLECGDGTHCPLCGAILKSSNVGQYCECCPWCDGMARLTPAEARKWKRKLAVPVSTPSNQYSVRWLPERGGKAVVCGNWEEVADAAKTFLAQGAVKVEVAMIRTFRHPKAFELGKRAKR